MRLLTKLAVIPILLCLMLIGCGGNSSQYTAKNEPAKQPAPAQQQAAPASTPAPAAEPAAAKATETKSAAPSKSAPQTSPAKPQATPAPADVQRAAQSAAQNVVQNAVQNTVQNAAQKAAAVAAEAPKVPTTPQEAPVKAVAEAAKKLLPKDVVILKGAPMGGVKFEHKLHLGRVANKCETCHHASKPEKPGTAPQQACSTCHTTVAVAPMKTKLQAAFHNPTATAGTCIDCHKAQNAGGKVAPVKCLDCHKKANI